MCNLCDCGGCCSPKTTETYIDRFNKSDLSELYEKLEYILGHLHDSIQVEHFENEDYMTMYQYLKNAYNDLGKFMDLRLDLESSGDPEMHLFVNRFSE